MKMLADERTQQVLLESVHLKLDDRVLVHHDFDRHASCRPVLNDLEQQHDVSEELEK